MFVKNGLFFGDFVVPEWHDQIAQANERRIRVGKEADDDVAVEHCHRRLVPVQNAVLNGPCRTPVEHARAVVLHLRLLKVKVLRVDETGGGRDNGRRAAALLRAGGGGPRKLKSY